MYLNLDHHAKTQVALLDDMGTSLTYGQLVAHLETTVFELPPRSLIFALSTNSVPFVADVLAMIHQGHVPLLLSADLEPELLNHLIATYRPGAIYAPHNHDALANGAVYENRHYRLKVTGETPHELHEDLELLLSTSGSTGSPKLVRFRRGNMEINARSVSEVFAWTPQERHIASLPLNYVMGLNAMLSHLSVGATVLLTSANLMETAFWDFIRTQAGTNFTGVPFSYELLLRLRPERMDLPQLKTFAQGGGKLAEKTFRKMAQLATDHSWRFVPTYGTTETAARCSFLSPDLVQTKTLSIGQPIPNVVMELHDSNGQAITTPHTEGELVIKGPHVAMGYALAASDLAKGDDFGGVYRTGDLASFDEDGCFYIKGRLSRFIKMLGNRIGLDECEQIIRNEWGVPVTCIGQEDAMIILTESELHHDEIRRSLAAKLKLQPSLFKVVRRSEIPRTATGKIRYRDLEQDYFS